MIIAERKVFVNKKIFKKTTKDALGRTNCQRMALGLAPIGIDGYPVTLHHLHQQNDGVLVEILDTEHRSKIKDLHSYKSRSEIDRTSFNNWKKSIG